MPDKCQIFARIDAVLPQCVVAGDIATPLLYAKCREHSRNKSDIVFSPWVSNLDSAQPVDVLTSDPHLVLIGQPRCR